MSALPEYLDEEVARLTAAEQPEDEPGPPRRTKSIRFSQHEADLLPWFETYGETVGISTNRALITALAAFKAAVERQSGSETGATSE